MDNVRATALPTAAWFGVFGLLLSVGHIAYASPLGPLLAYGLSFCLLCGIVMLTAWCLTPYWHGWSGALPITGALLIIGLMNGSTSDAMFGLTVGFCLLIACTIIGVYIGRRIEHAAHLWPLTIVMVAFDLWSVFATAGVTQSLVVDPTAVSTRAVLVLAFPIIGLGVEPVLGIGDVIVVGLLYSAAHHLALSVRALSVGLAAGFLSCLVSLVIWQVPLPALAFIVPLSVAALGSAARPQGRELFVAVIFCLVGLSALHWLTG